MYRMVWLETKIKPPNVAAGVLNRQRLLKLFKNNDNTRLFVIKAPAGYGKTTLLSQYVDMLSEQVAWLTIDAADNDPVRFWQYVSYTIMKQINPSLVKSIKTREDIMLEVDELLQAITNNQEPLHMILDDYQLIHNPVIHQQVNRFIQYLPSQVKLYITTRAELPIALERWRANQTLVEISRQQLCFTYQELEKFAKNRDKSVDTTMLHTLLDLTEGWITAIQLVSLTTNWQTEGMQAGHEFIQNYILQEVLPTLDDELQQFLLMTSMLNELTVANSTAITQMSNTEYYLNQLAKNDIFTVRLKSKEQIYRYHPLFVAALQHELQQRYTKEDIAKFYYTAAKHLYAKGDYVQAIELLLANQQYEKAEQWMIAHLVDLFTSQQVVTFKRWVNILKVANYDIDLEILIMYLIVLGIDYELDEAVALTNKVNDKIAQGNWQAHPDYQSLIYILNMTNAFIYFAGGKDGGDLKELFHHTLQQEIPPSRWDQVPMNYNASQPSLLLTSVGARGRLVWRKDIELFQQFFEGSSIKETNLVGFGIGVSAETSYHRGELTRALFELESALLLGRQYNDMGLCVPMYILKAKIHVAQKNYDAAYSVIQHALKMDMEHHWRELLRTMQVYIDLQSGAKDIRASLFTILHVQESDLTMQHMFWKIAYVRLLITEQAYEEALHEIIHMREHALNEQQITWLVEIGILEAICYRALDQVTNALIAIQNALTTAIDYRYITLFIQNDDALAIVRMYAKVQQDAEMQKYMRVLLKEYQAQTPLIERELTPREYTLIHLLKEGASNSEMAVKLGLSEGTIRVYLSTIYSKLGVTSRAKAIAKIMKL